jgi:hypothetical protein
MVIKNYIETRPTPSVPFWHETPSVSSWLVPWEQSLLNDKKMISLSVTISEDQLTMTRVAAFESEDDFIACLIEGPNPDYKSERMMYNTENNIAFISFEVDE